MRVLRIVDTGIRHRHANRLRLATAPEDVREMVAARYDTLSAAYELMKVEDKRRRKAYFDAPPHARRRPSPEDPRAS